MSSTGGPSRYHSRRRLVPPGQPLVALDDAHRQWARVMADAWRELLGGATTVAMSGRDKTLENDLMGRCGEIAVALYLGVPLHVYPENPKRGRIADCGDLVYKRRRVDVKTTRQGGHLWIKKADRERMQGIDCAILVEEVKHLELYRLLGWIGMRGYWAAAQINHKLPFPAYEVRRELLGKMDDFVSCG